MNLLISLRFDVDVPTTTAMIANTTTTPHASQVVEEWLIPSVWVCFEKYGIGVAK